MKTLTVGDGPQGRVARGIQCAHPAPPYPFSPWPSGAGQKAVAEASRKTLAGNRTYP